MKKKQAVPASFEKSLADKEKKGQKEGSSSEKKTDLKQVYGPGAPNPGFPMSKKDSGSKNPGPQPFPPKKKGK